MADKAEMDSPGFRYTLSQNPFNPGAVRRIIRLATLLCSYVSPSRANDSQKPLHGTTIEFMIVSPVTVQDRTRVSCSYCSRSTPQRRRFKRYVNHCVTETKNRTLTPMEIVQLVMVPANNHSERQPPDRETLHCPNCNHESRINGDWIIHILPNHLDYECPECGETIESRSDGSDMIIPT